jgi:hypothetical protein
MKPFCLYQSAVIFAPLSKGKRLLKPKSLAALLVSKRQ